MHSSDWWKEAVFYQIYPRSFADSGQPRDWDGIGDFPGMTSRLDYLKNLGVDALWISPCFPSPLYDVGYDISNYKDIAPEYGTLYDFQVFLEGAHQRGLRVILDLVLNHTSHLHPWFLESRSSRTNPKRDWYIWRDGVHGGPPNNWDSAFGGSAWEFDVETGQYYYHYFFKEQPDLNWHNPQVRQAMWEVVRFWLNMGVDGFRLDAIGTIFEDPLLTNHTSPMGLAQLQLMFLERMRAEEGRNAPAAGDNSTEGEFRSYFDKIFEKQVEFPEVHELMKELRRVVDEFPGRVLVGENDLVSYYGSGNDELHLVFNFPMMRTKRLTPQWVRANQSERLGSLPPGAWPCNTLGNHDSSRVKSAFGDGQHDDELARLSLALLLTLKGTPFLYYGEEIGMTDYLVEHPDQLRDNLGIFIYQSLIKLEAMTEKQAMNFAARTSRDRCRTPMQWENAPEAGFTRAPGQPWLPVNPDYQQGVNVADQINRPDSLLNFYRQILRLRKNSPALLHGEYRDLEELGEAGFSNDCLAFLRYTAGKSQTCLIILNFSEESHHLDLNKVKWGMGMKTTPLFKVLYSTHQHGARSGEMNHLEIAPFEIFISEIVS